MRRSAWFAAILVGTFLIAGAAVTEVLAVQSRFIPHSTAVNAIDRRPSPEILGALRAGWPIRGPVNSGFGARRSFWGTRVHEGVDIGARPGTPVRAPAPGSVVFAGWRGAYGRTVIIDHGRRVSSLYGHLSRLDVRPRQSLAAGAEIGRTGSTGRASGPHLHYEVRVNGRSVNPQGSGALRLVATHDARSPQVGGPSHRWRHS